MKKVLELRIVAFLCLLLLTSANVMAFEMSKEMQRYLDEALVSEDGIPSGVSNTGEFPFGRYLQQHWKAIIDNIETIAPTRRQQSALVASTIFFPPSEYLDFVDALWDRYRSKGGVLPETVVNTVLSPSGVRYGFLEVNYQHPKVRRICQTAQKLFPENQPLQSYTKDILSGKARGMAEDYLSQNNRKLPEVIGVKPTPTPISTPTPTPMPTPRPTPIPTTP
ncbi:MAG TPA: hypothetical protein VIT23_00740 [Terrimicrobiaceae bacterium]